MELNIYAKILIALYVITVLLYPLIIGKEHTWSYAGFIGEIITLFLLLKALRVI